MASLLDIAALRASVPIMNGEAKVEVTGVTAEGLVYLLHEFHELRALFAGKGGDLQMEDLLQQSPVIVAAFLSAGCGTPGNKEAEANARNLAVIDQMAILEKIWQVTFPKGLKDFLAALDRLAEVLAGGSGWDRATMSQGPLKNVFRAATQSAQPGGTPPVNLQDGVNSEPAAA